MALKTTLLLVIVSAWFDLSCQAQTTSFELEDASNKLIYRVTLPINFEPNKSYPLLLVPGFESKNEPPSVYIGNQPEKLVYIIVESILNIKGGMTIPLLKELKSKYNIQSIYISGFSANSIPMFEIVAKHAELFNGVIAMPGYANAITESVIQRNPDLKIILIVGERDTSWKAKAIKAKERLSAINAIVSLDIIPGQGHIMKSFAGEPFAELLKKTTLTQNVTLSH